MRSTTIRIVALGLFEVYAGLLAGTEHNAAAQEKTPVATSDKANSTSAIGNCR